MSEAPESSAPTAAAGAPQPKPLKSTLNLPQTAFPMKANLPVNEPLRLAAWEQADLYAQIRAARAGSPRYILHDGPPYANGAIHLGHALNKTLKDFVVKTKTMAGFDAPYVPGWDCHGLPIEIKVDEQLGRKKLEMDPVAVRRACREYAQKYLELQRAQFIRLGCFGRWFEPYSTMDPVYEARIAETFFHFFENGFVYKGLKPVSWCIHDRTALAEAEVEYEQHTSPSVYVRYKLTSDPAAIAPELAGKDVYTIIWTTTPWTLPASLAIAFHPEMEYVALGTPGASYIVAQALISEVIVHGHLMSAANPAEPATQTDIVALFKGSALDRTTFQHPFLDRTVLGTNATYVTADQGTGAVHTAPAHGVDDFATGKRYDLPEVQYVDDSGRQMHTERFGGGHPQPYEGLTVFKSNPVIVELLKEKGALLAASHFEHSYPHCWRCHNPVITRATEQWFIAMDTPLPSDAVILSAAKDLCISLSEQTPGDSLQPSSRPEAKPEWRDPRISSEAPHAPDTTSEPQEAVILASRSDGQNLSISTEPPTATTFRQRALDEIKRVTWDPAWGEERIANMVATRPDWCISRQRIWGVPIAVFLCRKCGEPLRDPAVNRRIVDLFMKESADAWYVHTPEEMLPAGTACKACGHSAFRKEMDILDVWFESGSSSHAVLDFDPDTQQVPGDPDPKDVDPRADLYAEGGDQHRGWFMSSLLCSIGMHNRAPFKSVATYGWTLDETGKALSKSMGSQISGEITDKLGAEIVRLWVASVDFREDVVASLPLLRRLAEDIYRKLRNTFRFLLGNLHDFDPSTNLVEDFATLEPLDQYMLARTAELTETITLAYAHFEFHRVYHALNEFCNSDLSALYLDVLKDRLYTFAPNHPARRSAQTVLYKIADALARLTAPILSFTSDEVWQSLPALVSRPPSVHLTLFPKPADLAPVVTEELLTLHRGVLQTDWDYVLSVRTDVLSQLEILRAQKIIGKSLEAKVAITVPIAEHRILSGFESALPELFNVSRVDVHYAQNPLEGNYIKSVRSDDPKCERCWRHVPDVGHNPAYPTVCLRCVEALDAIDFPPYTATPSTNN